VFRVAERLYLSDPTVLCIVAQMSNNNGGGGKNQEAAAAAAAPPPVAGFVEVRVANGKVYRIEVKDLNNLDSAAIAARAHEMRMREVQEELDRLCASFCRRLRSHVYDSE
jgi:hypothetical protein